MPDSPIFDLSPPRDGAPASAETLVAQPPARRMLSARTAGILAALALLVGVGLGLMSSKGSVAKANQERDQAQEQLATAGAQNCVNPAPDLSRLARASSPGGSTGVVSWNVQR